MISSVLALLKESVRSTPQVLENLDMMIENTKNTDVKYWVDMIYRDKPYINKIFESWKPLASDCSKDSQDIADSIIKCTCAASKRLKFEIEDADIIAAKRTYTIKQIVSVKYFFIMIDFIKILIKF